MDGRTDFGREGTYVTEPKDVEFWATSTAPEAYLPLGSLGLRRPTLGDVPKASAAIRRSLEHLRPWMPWATDSYDEDGSREYIERSLTQWEERTTFNYGLVDGADAWLGGFGLMGRIGPGALEIGYWVHVDHSGQGYATRAAAALTDAGLALDGVERVEIHHDRDNVTSGRIPARLGYERLREQPGPMDSTQASGVHVVWAMSRAAWPSSPGAELLADVRA
jgi:ribosomal-protein-serine acetyltransferase